MRHHRKQTIDLNVLNVFIVYRCFYLLLCIILMIMVKATCKRPVIFLIQNYAYQKRCTFLNLNRV